MLEIWGDAGDPFTKLLWNGDNNVLFRVELYELN